MSQPLLEGPLIAAALFAVALVVPMLVPRAFRSTPSFSDNRRTASLDALRGLLASGVVIHHTVMTWYFVKGDGYILPPSRLITHLGQSSVALFFMITAFLFTFRVLEQGARFDWRGFWIGRVFRIVPVYLLLTVLVLVSVFWLKQPGWVEPAPARGPGVVAWMLAKLVSLPGHSGISATAQTVSGAAWTLHYEFAFFLALPVLALLARHTPARLVLALVSALPLLWLASVPGVLDPSIAMAFAGGVAAAVWVRHPALLQFTRSPVAAMIGMLALVAVLMVTPTAYALLPVLGLSVFFVVIASGNTLGGVLRAPPLIWLGDISYSLYLLHGFVLWVVFQCVVPMHWLAHSVVFIVTAVLAMMLAVLLASAVFITIERPAILLGRRVAAWLAGGSRVPAPDQSVYRLR